MSDTVQTEVIPANDPQAIPQALATLRAGGVVAFPTDTVYGVGALVHDAQAVSRLYKIKGRQAGKAIPVLIGSRQALETVAVHPSERALALAERFWPGALTLVLPRHPSLPEALSPLPTVGVRVPDHPVALALLDAAGPLAVTSANRSGQPETNTAQDVLEQLGGSIELLLDGGRTPGGQPSTVVALQEGQAVVLRPGPITLEQVEAALGE